MDFSGSRGHVRPLREPPLHQHSLVLAPHPHPCPSRTAVTGNQVARSGHSDLPVGGLASLPTRGYSPLSPCPSGLSLRTHPGGGFGTEVQAPVQDKRGWSRGLGEMVPESPGSGTSWYMGASIVQLTERDVKRFKTWYCYSKGIFRTNKHFMEVPHHKVGRLHIGLRIPGHSVH